MLKRTGRERQIHADTTTSHQQPSQVSTSSLRTQPLSYRGTNVLLRYKGQTSSHHRIPTWRCRTDIPLILHRRIPTPEPWWQRIILEVGEFWYEAMLGPSPLTHFDTQANDTLKQAKACVYNSPLSAPNGDWNDRRHIHRNRRSDIHLSLQQMTCTDTIKSIKITFLKPWPLQYCFGLLLMPADTTTQHLSNTPSDTRWGRTNWSNRCLTPRIQAVASHTGVRTRQLMKKRHCWQHHQAHSEPSQAHFLVLPLNVFPPTWNSAFLSRSSSSSPPFLPLIFLPHASLFSCPFFWVPPFLFDI